MDEIVQLIEIPKLFEMGECVGGLDWLDWFIWFIWLKICSYNFVGKLA